MIISQMNAERAAGPAGHNLGPRKIKYGGRLNNPHAICKRHPQLGPSHKRHNLRLKLKNNKKKAASLKLQATSALKGPQLNNIYEESAEDI
jgi:hypothetical protein